MNNQMLETAQHIIITAAERLGLGKEVIKRLVEPEMIHEFAIPVQMDSGKVEIFKGFRAQHNSALGPYKGGIRFHQYENVTHQKSPATFTGKPVEKGGSLGRNEATGRGGVIILNSLIKKIKTEIFPHKKNLTVAVQGFGNVGSFFAVLAEDAGFDI